MATRVRRKLNQIKVNELLEKKWCTIQELSDAYGLAGTSISKMLTANLDKVTSYIVPGIRKRFVNVEDFDTFRKETHLATGDVIKILNNMKATGVPSSAPSRV